MDWEPATKDHQFVATCYGVKEVVFEDATADYSTVELLEMVMNGMIADSKKGRDYGIK